MIFKNIITANFKDDSLSLINNVDPTSSKRIYLKDLESNGIEFDDRKGPISLVNDNDDNLLLINALNDSLYKIDLGIKKIKASISIGRYPRDIKFNKDRIYIICSDSNSLSIVDNKKLTLIENIYLGNNPNSMEIDSKHGKIYISNLESKSINIISLSGDMKELRVEDYPLAVKVFNEELYLLSIISLGTTNYSRLSIYKRQELVKVWDTRIKGLFYDFVVIKDIDGIRSIYLTSPEDGYLYQLSERKGQLVKLAYLGELPMRIIFDGNRHLYINDILGNQIIIYNMEGNSIEFKIKVGTEPQGILLL